MANNAIDPYVLGAWIIMCQNMADNQRSYFQFDILRVDQLIDAIKSIMQSSTVNVQKELKETMACYGIDFSVVKKFRRAPVQGYINQKKDKTYQIVLTIRGTYADIFWFSLFHELGHIVNGDIGKTNKFVDDGTDEEKEAAADLFARDKIIDKEKYTEFINRNVYSIEATCRITKSNAIYGDWTFTERKILGFYRKITIG